MITRKRPFVGITSDRPGWYYLEFAGTIPSVLRHSPPVLGGELECTQILSSNLICMNLLARRQTAPGSLYLEA